MQTLQENISITKVLVGRQKFDTFFVNVYGCQTRMHVGAGDIHVISSGNVTEFLMMMVLVMVRIMFHLYLDRYYFDFMRLRWPMGDVE